MIIGIQKVQKEGRMVVISSSIQTSPHGRQPLRLRLITGLPTPQIFFSGKPVPLHGQLTPQIKIKTRARKGGLPLSHYLRPRQNKRLQNKNQK